MQSALIASMILLVLYWRGALTSSRLSSVSAKEGRRRRPIRTWLLPAERGSDNCQVIMNLNWQQIPMWAISTTPPVTAALTTTISLSTTSQQTLRTGSQSWPGERSSSSPSPPSWPSSSSLSPRWLSSGRSIFAERSSVSWNRIKINVPEVRQKTEDQFQKKAYKMVLGQDEY